MIDTLRLQLNDVKFEFSLADENKTINYDKIKIIPKLISLQQHIENPSDLVYKQDTLFVNEIPQFIFSNKF